MTDRPSALVTSLDTRRRRWVPLLDGADRTEALDQVLQIASALRDHAQFSPTYSKNDLLSGGLGLALLFAELAEALPGEGHESVARDLLFQAVETGWTRLPARLYGGYCGFGWAVDQLRKKLGVDEDDHGLYEVDQALLTHLARSPWRQDYDLIEGLVGMAVYALDRLPNPIAAACLERLLDRLSESCRQGPPGTSWFTAPECLEAGQRRLAPQGWENLGLSHGAAGILVVLSEIHRTGIGRSSALALIDEAAAELARGRLAWDDVVTYGAHLLPGARPKPSRLAWCYGDAGIAAALLAAARNFGRLDWEQDARALALQALSAHPGREDVEEPGLCHGAAGLAHIFNRFYQAGGDGRFRDGVRHWVRKLYELRSPGQGIGGYRSEEGRGERGEDPSILTGSLGIALSLLAAATSVEPSWDHLLLLSIPPG